MIVRFHNYKRKTVLPKLQFNNETKVFSFVYKDIQFETSPLTQPYKGPLSFWGKTCGIIDESEEPDFANTLASSLSQDFECYVEAMCTYMKHNKMTFAYYKGEAIKEPNFDNKLLENIVQVALIDAETKQGFIV